MNTLTILNRNDGFGSQLNAKLSGFAFCEKTQDYRYIHTPFVHIGHEWSERADDVNRYMNFPSVDTQAVDESRISIPAVWNDPGYWYDSKVLTALRCQFWEGPSDKSAADIDIAVHIRRGDVNRNSKNSNGRACGRTRARYQTDRFWNKFIPKIAAEYPDSYIINIYSEGRPEDFQPIFDGPIQWPDDLLQRVVLKVDALTNNAKISESIYSEYNMLNSWHEMVSAKVLVQAKSGLSYTAGIYNENDVWFSSHSHRAVGQKHPLSHWKIFAP